MGFIPRYLVLEIKLFGKEGALQCDFSNSSYGAFPKFLCYFGFVLFSE